MCGGVGFKTKNIPEEELKKYYSPELIKRFKTSGRIESFFWDKQPVLPMQSKNGIELKKWGNRDQELKLPKTGWAKEESLKKGKWGYLHPELVNIPVEDGYEKKVWFNLPEGTKGILVKKENEERVYIITKEATEDYKKNTKHDREPLGKKIF